MGRKTRVVTITAEGRDRGKKFLLTEMPADQGEWWAIRALSILGNAGLDLPKEALDAGMAGLASSEATRGAATALFVVGLRMLPGVNLNALHPLLEEMLTCVQYQPPGNFSPQPINDGVMSQIEEIPTRLQIRADLLELHLGFSLAGLASTSADPDPSQAPAS